MVTWHLLRCAELGYFTSSEFPAQFPISRSAVFSSLCTVGTFVSSRVPTYGRVFHLISTDRRVSNLRGTMQSTAKRTRAPRSEVAMARYRITMAEERVKKLESRLQADRELIREMHQVLLANGERR